MGILLSSYEKTKKSLNLGSNSICLSYNALSEPIVIKFHIEPPGLGGTKCCSNGPVYMINMAATPIHGKNI